MVKDLYVVKDFFKENDCHFNLGKKAMQHQQEYFMLFCITDPANTKIKKTLEREQVKIYFIIKQDSIYHHLSLSVCLS